MLADLLNISVVVFAATSMFSVGVTYTLRQILGPLRRVRLVAAGLVANFVLVPAWALLVTWLLQLDEPYKVGILLVAAAAGAAFLVKLVAIADGDVAFASSLLVLLLPVTVLYMPLVVPLIAVDADVSAPAIATPLVLTTLLPLAVGVVTLAALPSLAERVRPVLGPLSTAALVGVLVFTVAANADDLLGVIGERAILAALLLVVGAFVIGFALGGGERAEMALATAQRNIAAATVVATQTIGDSETIVTVVVTSTVSMLVLFPLATQLKKRLRRTALEARANSAGSD